MGAGGRRIPAGRRRAVLARRLCDPEPRLCGRGRALPPRAGPGPGHAGRGVRLLGARHRPPARGGRRGGVRGAPGGLSRPAPAPAVALPLAELDAAAGQDPVPAAPDRGRAVRAGRHIGQSDPQADEEDGGRAPASPRLRRSQPTAGALSAAAARGRRHDLRDPSQVGAGVRTSPGRTGRELAGTGDHS